MEDSNLLRLPNINELNTTKNESIGSSYSVPDTLSKSVLNELENGERRTSSPAVVSAENSNRKEYISECLSETVNVPCIVDSLRVPLSKIKSKIPGRNFHNVEPGSSDVLNEAQLLYKGIIDNDEVTIKRIIYRHQNLLGLTINIANDESSSTSYTSIKDSKNSLINSSDHSKDLAQYKSSSPFSTFESQAFHKIEYNSDIEEALSESDTLGSEYDLITVLRNSLQLAVINNSVQCCKELLIAGADPSISGISFSNKWRMSVSQAIVNFILFSPMVKKVVGADLNRIQSLLIPEVDKYLINKISLESSSEKINKSSKHSNKNKKNLCLSNPDYVVFQSENIRQIVHNFRICSFEFCKRISTFAMSDRIKCFQILTLSTLINTINEDNKQFLAPALFIGIYKANLPTVKLMLTESIMQSLQSRDCFGNTAAHICCLCKSLEKTEPSDMHKTLSNNNNAMLKLIITNGFRLGKPNRFNLKPVDIYPEIWDDLNTILKNLLTFGFLRADSEKNSDNVNRDSSSKKHNRSQNRNKIRTTKANKNNNSDQKSSSSGKDKKLKDNNNKSDSQSYSVEMERTSSTSSNKVPSKEKESFAATERKQSDFSRKFSFIEKTQKPRDLSLRMKYEDAESSLKTMTVLAKNPECLTQIIDGIDGFISMIISINHQTNEEELETLISQLFNQIIKTISNKLRECSNNSSQAYVYMLQMTQLLDISMDLLRQKQYIHYTALTIINKLLDLCFINSVYEYMNIEGNDNEKDLGDREMTGLSTNKTNTNNNHANIAPTNTGHNRRQSVVNVINNIRSTGTKIIGSFESGSVKAKNHNGSNIANTSSGNAIQSTGECGSNRMLDENRTIYRKIITERINQMDPGIILSVLHNRITMQKRTLNNRIKCSPSTRMRSCVSHCIQILSARILAVMAQSTNVQRRLLTDGHFKTLVDALDPNHDPHLLCLLLQCLATIAIDPTYHEALSKTMIEDNLLHLILPSDEWYYTNYSTKYSPYVKYHASKILVYLGKFHCLAGRFDLFNSSVFDFIHGTGNYLTDNLEDVFIHNMAMGRHMIYRGDMALVGCSVECMVRLLLEDHSSTVEFSQVPEQFTKLFSFLGSDDIHFKCILTDRLREALLLVLPAIIHPLIIIRLLNHRLFGRSYKKKIRHLSAKKSQCSSSINEHNMEHSKNYDPTIMKKVNIKESNMVSFDTSETKSETQANGKYSIEKLPHISDTSNTDKKHSANIHAETIKGKEYSLNPIFKGEDSVNNNNNGKEKNSQNPSKLYKDTSINDSLFALQNEKSIVESILEKNTKRFAKWRSSLKKKTKHNNTLQEMEDNKIENSTIAEKELLDLQRELVNLPKISLDPFLGDSRSASPSLLLSRSNSLPNVNSENTPAGSFIINSSQGIPSIVTNDQETKSPVRQYITEISRDRSLPEIYISPSLPIEKNEFLNSVLYHINNSDKHHKKVEHFQTNSDSSSRSITTLSTSNASMHTDSENSKSSKIVKHKKKKVSQSMKEKLISSKISQSNQSTMSLPIENKVQKFRKASLSSNSSTERPRSLLFLPKNITLSLMKKTAEVPSLIKSEFDSMSIQRPTSPNFSLGNESSIPESNFCYSMKTCEVARNCGDIPNLHFSAMQLIDRWLHLSITDFSLIRDDVKEFLTRLSTQGSDQRLWCQNIWSFLKSQINTNKISKPDGQETYESTNIEYKRLKQLVTSGDLPCTKDDAATLATVHMHIDNSWPDVDAGTSNQMNSLFPDSNKSLSYLTRKMAHSRLTSSRMRSRKPFRMIHNFSCVSDKENERKKREIKRMLAKYIPPEYHDSKKTHELIKEKYKKLWHTPFYESEMKLKQLYIKLCKNLPAYGCRLFQVQEILRGNIHQNVLRLLGVSPTNITLIDHKSKVLIRSQAVQNFKNWHLSRNSTVFELEFRASKPWVLNCISENSMRSLTSTLWEVLDYDGKKTPKQAFRRSSLEFDLQNKQINLRPDMENGMVYAAELDELTGLIQFPEEVALMLAQTELKLFQSLQPQSYVRYVSLDLSHIPQVDKGVWNLITRLKEVSSWIIHLIITQPTHEERKNIFSCIVRLAIISYGIGNFNAVVEILAGLRSDKLKPFWLTINDVCKDELNIIDLLSEQLLSKEPTESYRSVVSRALKIPNTNVIPFFGVFLSQLKTIVNKTPTILILPSNEGAGLSCISDFNGEDKFISRIGVGGLINMNKVKEVLTILNDIFMFQIHNIESSKMDKINDEDLDYSTRNKFVDDPFLEEFYIPSTQPIVDMINISNVIIIQPRLAKIDPHCLQLMHMGTTVFKQDKDLQKCVPIFMKLSLTNSLIMWSKPTSRISQFISSKSASPNNNSKQKPCFSFLDCVDSKSPFHIIQQTRYTVSGTFFCTDSANLSSSNQTAGGLLDGSSGYIDIFTIKNIDYSNGRHLPNISSIMRKFGYKDNYPLPDHCCISIIYGCSASENKVMNIVFPIITARYWLVGLSKLVMTAKMLRKNADQKMLWLKNDYLRLFYTKEFGQALTLAEVTKSFGGRRWSVSNSSSVVPDPNSAMANYALAFNNKSRTKLTNKSKKSDQQQIFNLFNKNTSRFSDTQVPGQTPLSVSMRTRSQEQIPISSSSQNALSIINTPSYLRHSTFYSYAMLNSKRRQSARILSAGYDYLEMSSLSVKDSSKKVNYQELHNVNSTDDITQKSYLNFMDFCYLFRSFTIYSRSDIKQIFDQLCVKLSESETKSSSNCGRIFHRENYFENEQFHLTRNYPSTNKITSKQKHVSAAVAVASIITNCSGLEKSEKWIIPLTEIKHILQQFQGKRGTDDDCCSIIEKHEVDTEMRARGMMTYEGFASYMMDEDNFIKGILSEDQSMDHPLSHYFIASSHNTYLSGHQITGESSVEMYAQVLLSGCRCIELDCWDGEDGTPVIYHGHTFTNKISFQSVVETIDRCAFTTSPYPVILSIENHCSLVQQQKMAQIFSQVFGDKLVNRYLFDSDLDDDPYLPSPNQLKFRILIKNKKLTSKQSAFQTKTKTQAIRNSSIGVVTDSGLASEDIGNMDDDEDENDDEDDNSGTAATATKDSLEVITRKLLDLSSKDSSATDGNTDSGLLKKKDFTSSLGLIKSDLKSESTISSTLDIQGGKLGIQDWQFDDISSSHSIGNPNALSTPALKPATKIKTNKASQVDPGLSELVVYTQAVKLRSLNLKNSPQTNQKSKKGTIKRTVLPQCHLSGTNLTAIVSNTTSTSSGLNLKVEQPTHLNVQSLSMIGINSSPQSSGTSLNYSTQKRYIDANPPSHQIASVNESKAKSICRRIPTFIISHCEKQLIRTYPAGIRLDSSNFNPVIFWAFGIQMVALNYQTEDQALEVNQAMFRQSNDCGYVLKPEVMWNKNHVLFNKFNPWEKEFEGIKPCYLTIQIVSGQNLNVQNPTGSPLLEIEIIGIQLDCIKCKTRPIQRNMINPNWFETFQFKIAFPDLAFIRFAVIDVSSAHLICQKVFPVKTLKKGFRHIPLKFPTVTGNTFFDIATLFVFISMEDEINRAESDQTQSSQEGGSSSSISYSLAISSLDMSTPKTATLRRKYPLVTKAWKGSDNRDTLARKTKEKVHYIFLSGVCENENYTILKISGSATAYDVIYQALHKAGKLDDRISNYVLLQEPTTIEEIPRLIGLQENIETIIEKSNSTSRFILKRNNNDPSSRAWMTTIMNEDSRRRKEEECSFDQNVDNCSGLGMSKVLVCIYNVSPEQPYTILRMDKNSTVDQVISLVLAKARRNDNPKDFVLVEEIFAPHYQESPGGTSRMKNTKKSSKRILDGNESVYLIQKQSNASGKILLMPKNGVEEFISGSAQKKSSWNFLLKSSKDNLADEKLIKAKESQSITSPKESEEDPTTSGLTPPPQFSDNPRFRTCSCPTKFITKITLPKQQSCPTDSKNTVSQTTSSQASNNFSLKLQKFGQFISGKR